MKRISLKKASAFILALLMLTGIIMMKNNSDANAAIPTEPRFDVSIDSIKPQPALLGEDITVTGQIIPHDFEADVTPKEIILVLDTSGSMKDDIVCYSNLKCTTEGHSEGQCVYEECNIVRKGSGSSRYYYCNTHKVNCGNSNPGKCSKNDHNWKISYCDTHKKNSVHYSSKIEELKLATKAFINTMKDVENLKIGIIRYSSNATILTQDTNNNPILIDAKDTSKLNSIIDNLSATGGTNTGEGLRKAIFLLSDKATGQSLSSDKTVILMSDGEPTYYSRTGSGTVNNEPKYYMSIDDEDPDFGGEGSSDSKGYSLEYASSKIGKLIKESKYSVYTIGYGMDDSGNQKMQKIHTAMGGEIPTEETPEEEKTFFADGADAIDSIFAQIAENIKNSYGIPIYLDLSVEANITTNIEGNVLKIKNINYVAEKNTSTGKTIYKAKPQPFEFVIRANTVGTIEIFNNSNMKYTWNGEERDLYIPPKVIEVIDNQKLSINATLSSAEIVDGENGVPVNVTYDITADEFQYNDSSNRSNKDIIFVFDVGKKMSVEKLKQIQNNVFDKILNNDELKSVSQYGVLYYSNGVKAIKNLTSNINDINTFISSVNVQNQSSSHMGDAIPEIISMLNDRTYSRKDADKYVIFISEGKLNYQKNSSVELQNESYNVITLNVGEDDRKANFYPYDFHKRYLGKLDENYFVSAVADGSDIGDVILQQIADRLLTTGTFKPYTRSVELKFDLNSNFTAGEGVTSVNGNEAIIKIPDVVFRHYKEGNMYKADPIEPVSFTIIPKEETSGELKFGISNVISYKNIINTDINKQIKTPIVSIGDINHGLDLGFSDGDVLFQEENVSIASDMQFGVVAKKTISNTPSSLELRINKDIDLNDPSSIKIYKLVEGELIEIKAMVTPTSQNTESINNNQNRYIIEIGERINGKTELIIRYQCKMQSNSANELPDGTVKPREYINNVIFGKQQQPFTIKGAQLPDLF